jgi:hypothetical protein
MSVDDEVDGGAWSTVVGAECSGDVGVALPTEEGEDEVASGGHDLRGSTGADGGAIFVEGDVADMVQSV